MEACECNDDCIQRFFVAEGASHAEPVLTDFLAAAIGMAGLEGVCLRTVRMPRFR